MHLVIMESPSKAQTVKGYLGAGYKVIASLGHIRDLPKSTFGIDVANHFQPHYINIRGKGDLIDSIKKDAKSADKILIATDPDREGEAIAWHLACLLGLSLDDDIRVSFNEVTKSAVKNAIKHPRKINMDLVDAQQTRRIMDRMVGYKLSPLLWKNVKNGLSAGRVQSVATRLVVERENEIKAFVPKEYWTLDVKVQTGDESPLIAHYWGEQSGRVELKNEKQTLKIANDVRKNGCVKVLNVKKAIRHNSPQPPFTTSTLQQEAFKKLGFQSDRTMRIAQQLYEGVNVGQEFGGVQGVITYMRTDSKRISTEAQEKAHDFIIAEYGASYVPESFRIFKSDDGIQDAHEAIRPADVKLEPKKIGKNLTADQRKLYKLIWERFVASQMANADLDTISVEFGCDHHTFKTGAFTVAFPGFMTVYQDDHGNIDEEESESEQLPNVTDGSVWQVQSVNQDIHFTEAPSRYNDASLTKTFEERGIGRPSTYNSIIQTISKNYVVREGKSFVPTTLGYTANTLMVNHFPSIVDYEFTAEMERQLDKVEEGETSLNQVLSAFWQDFSRQLGMAEVSLEGKSIKEEEQKTDLICEKCGRQMVVKNSRFGKFAACPGYPKCKNTKPMFLQSNTLTEKETPTVAKEPETCELCGGSLVIKSGKYGDFYACSHYPECKYTRQIIHKIKDVFCPLCHSEIVVKYTKSHTAFYGCASYPECRFSTWDLPLAEKCPQCGQGLYYKKIKNQIVCHNQECHYIRVDVMNDGEQGENGGN